MVNGGAIESGTVLITGVNRGIGLELARRYAGDGWHVLACCRNPEQAGALKELGAEVHALDVSDQGSIDTLKRGLGDRPIDVLINNAGVGGGDRQSFGDIDYTEWERTLEVNTFGPYRVIMAFLDNVRAGSGKRIANVSSQMGSITQYSGGDEYIYRSSKTALNMVVHNLAIDLADTGVIFLTLHPGWVRTDMGGEEAPVLPADSAEGLARVINTAKTADSGGFYDYQGNNLPW